MVDVLAEEVERGDSLDQAALDEVPFARGNNSRDNVKWKDFFHASRIVVDRKGDPLVAKCDVGQAPASRHRAVIQLTELLRHRRIMRPGRSSRLEHLIKQAIDLI